ncbi:MAG: hypothetical protein SRB2_02815 [Desulfobacteraceae bacterium Eth-SRB2]|nr:MAG: hypothetical protein SRB2_02815 [Desulfobacteraceae bacterium Eth-SRB2]
MLGVNSGGICALMRKNLLLLKSLFHWIFVDWRWLHANLLVVALPVFIGLRYGASESKIRYYGLVLQLLGILTVAWGIRTTRKEFGHPSIFKRWQQRLSRFPLFGKREVKGTVDVAAACATASGRWYSSVKPESEANIEARVQALEENLPLIHDRISQTQNEMDRGFREVLEALKQEKRVREKEEQDIRAKLEATETGDLHISAIGVFWLFVGIIMSTVSADLAELLIKNRFF